MNFHRSLLIILLTVEVFGFRAVQADSVLDWNATACHMMQHDGVNAVNNANPGWSTRSFAMLNGAIYDVFQATDRTHKPFLVNTHALSDTSRAAAVHQTAYEVLLATYPGESSILLSEYNSQMGTIANGSAKANGIALGSQIAQQYIANRANDNANVTTPYTPGTAVGEWWPQPGQSAWGPGWGTVKPFAIGDTKPYVDNLPAIPAIDSPEYTAAFEMVKDYGGRTGSSRSDDQTDIGLFWAYDRATMGPPPVLFNKNLTDIAVQAGNSEEQNARLFALASVAMADAATAAWDSKYSNNLWRPIAAVTGQRSDYTTGHDDGNPNTIEDANWLPLGGPGTDPNDWADDFTPPFPAWTSGHATMGGALFKAIELFYGTNVFDEIDGIIGDDLEYTLTSQEWDYAGVEGMSRQFSTFTQTGLIDVGTENSPEGENAMSRIYLGVHWIFDQRDGNYMGNDIATFVAGNYFQAVPEPSSIALLSILAIGSVAWRRWNCKASK